MDTVNIVIPISRDLILERLFASLELMTTPPNTNLLTVVDGGDKKLYEKVRNLTEMSKFKQRLCTFRKDKPIKNLSIRDRRLRIAKIHNEIKGLMTGAHYVFGIEDDTIVPSYALKRLMRAYEAKPSAGFIQGAEIGRWGVNYIGAWQVDDIYDTKKFTSLPLGEGLQEIDAGGFYCFLTKYEHYVNHNFKPYENNVLGPDIDYGIAMRQQGMRNFTDWNIKCKHYNRNGGIISFSDTDTVQIEYFLHRKKWLQNVL